MILLLTISCGAQALGFGSISVESYLNEPLDARIALVSINSAEAEGLRVSLADPEAFKKAGLIRPPHLNKLRFKTEVDKNQQVYIHVTTQDGVREPFLNFLLEVAAGKETLLREYTILLDPPAGEVRDVRLGPSVGKTGQKAKGSVAPQVASKKTAKRKSYGPVKRTETLWVIATRVRPDSSVSVEQMMMALLRANPDAFLRGNVNLLQQGAVLDIPDYDTITKMSASEAHHAFLQQNNDWKVLKGGGKETSAAVPDEASGQTSQVGSDAVETRPEVATENAVVNDSAKLRVVETGREETETVAAEEKLFTDEAIASGVDRMSDEIAESKKDLAEVREINRDLEELKDALELKIEALRNSLEERDRIIDKLEQRLSEMKADSKTTAGKVRGADSIVGEPRKVPGGVDSKIEMGRKQAEEPTPSEPVVTEPKQTDWLALAEKYWLQLVIAAVLILVLLLVLLLRRRRSGSDITDPDAFGSYIDVDSQTVTEEHDLLTEDTDEIPAKAENERSEGDFSPSSRADVASALTEADIYLAYRRYGPAEELIKQAIDNHPENMILKAKLLEIYAYRKDKNKFVSFMEQVYQSMIARSPEIWAKVVEMGRDITPDHELIAGATLSDDEADSMVNSLSFDLDDLTESRSGKRNDTDSEKEQT